MMTHDSSQWHWQEGMKYALEGIKLLFVLNGASAVSILTFIGNAKIYSEAFIFSMVSFSLGAVGGIIAMLLAYLTQLHYGNSHTQSASVSQNDWNSATRFHYAAYLCIFIAISLFLFGVGSAAFGIYQRPVCVVV